MCGCVSSIRDRMSLPVFSRAGASARSLFRYALGLVRGDTLRVHLAYTFRNTILRGELRVETSSMCCEHVSPIRNIRARCGAVCGTSDRYRERDQLGFILVSYLYYC